MTTSRPKRAPMAGIPIGPRDIYVIRAPHGPRAPGKNTVLGVDLGHGSAAAAAWRNRLTYERQRPMGVRRTFVCREVAR
jgi:hypothetical protein